ncbi:capsule biosynthesis protein [Beijerinckia sp. L45]|uniref:capsule biosynthesis protein n=1 Tax=Beijerinckia sp. L45 TaxID=1641855 RepID=UPI00131AB987|nr:capsule biosynthesis protein [Beijerinckia sp. L45]
MSDVRDPEERIEMPVLEVEPPRGRTLASRALAPLLRVARLEPPRPRAEILVQPDGSFDLEPEPRRKPNIVLISLILVVLLPILTAGLYLFFVAADQYAAETRFAVKTASGGSDDSGGKGETSIASVMTSGGSLGGQEADIVANYIQSRAIIDDIARTVDVRAIFQRPEADFWAKLPTNASTEDLTAYWKKMISVYIESTSGIVTVEARAFRREDALLLAKAIVKSSETLVNDLSSNVRADAVKHAEDEIRRAEADVRFALADLTVFRNTQGIIDPVKSAEQSGKLLLQLMGDKIQTESQLFVSQRTTGPDAPGVAATKARLESIDEHIATLQQQLAGDKTTKANLASTISKFEQLDLKRQFAERMYGFARDGMDRARLIAERQSVYLAVFVPPSLPQDYSYPLRFSDFALIAMAAMVAWSCGATIWASVLDHRL